MKKVSVNTGINTILSASVLLEQEKQMREAIKTSINEFANLNSLLVDVNITITSPVVCEVEVVVWFDGSDNKKQNAIVTGLVIDEIRTAFASKGNFRSDIYSVLYL